MSIESGAELPRVTVAKAIEVARNIISDTQDENRFPSTLNVYTRDVTDNGDVNPYPDGRKYRTELVKGKDKALDLLRASFLRFCAQTGTKPRNMHDVWNDDSYTGTAFNEDYEHDISASEMAIWIARFKTATDLPIMQEKAMSTPATEAQAAPAKPTNGATNTAAIGRVWQESAREIADECFDHDTNAKPPVRDSLLRLNKRGDPVGGYAVRVMRIMQERGIHGPRGLITNAATISRDALQGARWWAGKSK